MKTIATMFDDLGQPGNEGKAFAITLKCIEDLGLSHENIVEKLPRADYAHHVYLDNRTDNYLVIRPTIDGDLGLDVHGLTRIR